MNNSDLVSIIMPNFNADSFIARAIDSVLKQSWENWELIIIDDYSSDNSRDIIRKYTQKDARITSIFIPKKNGGRGLVRNLGIEQAEGRFLAFLDSDDEWHPKKLTKQIRYIVDKNAALCTTHTQIIDLNNDMLGTYEPQMEVAEWDTMLTENIASTSAMMIDREKKPEIQFLDYTYSQDYACWLTLMKDGQGIFILPEKLTFYRINPKRVNIKNSNTIILRWDYRIF